jgi:malate synthase
MPDIIEKSVLKVAPELAGFIDEKVLPGTGIEAEAFWRGVAGIFERFGPRNAALLAKRDAMQDQIDAWHEAIWRRSLLPLPSDRRGWMTSWRGWRGRSWSCRSSMRASC